MPVQTHRMNNTRVNDNINYGFWVIMKCQCRFISFNKYTILEGNVDNGGRLCLLWGRVGMWEISLPIVQFCCEPKSALKNVFLKRCCRASLVVQWLRISLPSRRHGFNPIPHATGELSPRATVTEPELQLLKPTHLTACAPQQGRPLQ